MLHNVVTIYGINVLITLKIIHSRRNWKLSYHVIDYAKVYVAEKCHKWGSTPLEVAQ